MSCASYPKTCDPPRALQFSLVKDRVHGAGRHFARVDRSPAVPTAPVRDNRVDQSLLRPTNPLGVTRPEPTCAETKRAVNGRQMRDHEGPTQSGDLSVPGNLPRVVPLNRERCGGASPIFGDLQVLPTWGHTAAPAKRATVHACREPLPSHRYPRTRQAHFLWPVACPLPAK
jgi:hypothetical protein